MLSLVQLYQLLLDFYGYQGWWPVDEGYHATKGTDLKTYVEENIPKDLTIYKEFHALIDEHAKAYCKSTPRCGGCFLKDFCLSAIPSS